MKTITEMTRELGGFAPTTKFLEAFADLVRADEREECAKVAERFEPDEKTSYVTYASTAIRARGNT